MKLARLPVFAAVFALLLLAASGLGVRAGLWAFPVGFSVLRWAAYVALAAVGLAVIGLLTPRARAAAPRTLPLALVLGLGVAFVPWQMLRQAKSVPPIHDISTDLTNPPLFEAVLPLRGGASNPAAYGGPELAAAQRAGYPDVQPLRLSMAPAQAYSRTLAAAQGMGWQVVAADAARGRIEATATTFWFGFKDDVVVRIQAADGGSRVDVRSVSRDGGSDVGTNAKRIRAFATLLQGSGATPAAT